MEIKPIKCKLCQVRYVRQQEWKKEFEKNHCAICFAFLKTLNSYEKALQEIMELSRIKNYRVRIYLEKPEPFRNIAEVIFGKNEQYKGELLKEPNNEKQ